MKLCIAQGKDQCHANHKNLNSSHKENEGGRENCSDVVSQTCLNHSIISNNTLHILCARIYTSSLKLPFEQSFYLEMSTEVLLRSLGGKTQHWGTKKTLEFFKSDFTKILLFFFTQTKQEMLSVLQHGFPA